MGMRVCRKNCVDYRRTEPDELAGAIRKGGNNVHRDLELAGIEEVRQHTVAIALSGVLLTIPLSWEAYNHSQARLDRICGSQVAASAYEH